MVPPLVSAIIPVYNGSAFIAQAIASIRDQDYAPLEILVIDDGSTDATADVVRGLGADIRYLRQENRGPAAARNRGLALARGSLIAFLDADDLWPQGKLRAQVQYLEEHPQVAIVLGRIEYLRLPGASEVEVRFEDTGDTVTSVHLGCGLFRRGVFDQVGELDATLRYSEDHDWMLRARELGIRMAILQRVTLQYRMHAGNMTRDKGIADVAMARVLKKSLDRRRARGDGAAQSLPRWSEHDLKTKR